MNIARALACAALAFAALLLAPLAANAEGPGLKVDLQWPKPLPNNWIMGQIGGITVDAQDNIWVFQRPRSLTDDEKGAALSPAAVQVLRAGAFGAGVHTGRRPRQSVGRPGRGL